MHIIKIPPTVSAPLSTFMVVEVQVKWSLRSLSLLMLILKVTLMLDKTSYGSLCVRSLGGMRRSERCVDDSRNNIIACESWSKVAPGR